MKVSNSSEYLSSTPELSCGYIFSHLSHLIHSNVAVSMEDGGVHLLPGKDPLPPPSKTGRFPTKVSLVLEEKIHLANEGHPTMGQAKNLPIAT